MENFTNHFVRSADSVAVDQKTNVATEKQFVTKIQTFQNAIFTSKPGISSSLKNLDSESGPSLRKLLQKTLPTANHNLKVVGSENAADGMTKVQRDLLKIMTTYRDLYSSDLTMENLNEFRVAYLTHVLNHILLCQKLLATNNRVLKKRKLEKLEEDRGHKSGATTLLDNDDMQNLQDQGFCRPRILILTPFRHGALQIVQLLTDLLFDSDSKRVVANRKKFQSEYGYEKDEEEADSQAKPRFHRPDDFEKLFAGNTDDCFRLGVALSKKSISLYADLEASDLIIASPLGVRTATGSDEDKEFNADFLSSIEVLVFELADLFLMQNWSHVIHIMDHLNKKPHKLSSITANLNRVWQWHLDGQANFYRQTVLFSRVNAPDFKGLFSKFCQNFDGMFTCVGLSSKLIRPAIEFVQTAAPQAFHRFHSASLQEDADKRFDFFRHAILEQMRASRHLKRVLIFVPSYFDFVRVRNLLRSPDQEGEMIGDLELTFVQLSEYADDKKISRGRDLFYHGKKRIALITERFHFYKRYQLRGVRHVIFYQLPVYSQFYAEVCNWLVWNEKDDAKIKDAGAAPTCSTIYSKYDSLRLADLLGAEQASRLINDDKHLHIIDWKT